MQRFIQNVRLTVRNGIRYLPLLKNLIQRELKKKYRRSILGYVWCILNPLLVMLILNVVFSRLFSRSIPNYPVYLFSGRMIFSFITDASSSTMRSIVNNGMLMRKTRIPYYIFPLSTLGCSVVNFFFTLIAFALLLIGTGTGVSIHILAFPLVVLETAMFAFGIGLLLAICYLYVADTHYIYSVFITGWTYLTPLFYPLETLSGRMQWLISHLNPAYFYVTQSRDIFLYNRWPDSTLMLYGFIIGAAALALGLAAYQKTKDTMYLYV